MQKNKKTTTLFYKNIDFLTVRIIQKTELVNTLYGLVDNSDTYTLIDWLRISYFGNVAGNRLKVYHILSEDSVSDFSTACPNASSTYLIP